MKIELLFNDTVNDFSYCAGAVLNVDSEGGAALIARGHKQVDDSIPARKNAGLYTAGQCAPTEQPAQQKRQKPPTEVAE